MNRRGFLQLPGAVAATAAGPPVADPAEIVEASIASLQKRMAAGTLTARRLTEAYLQRIEALDRAGPRLASVIEVNPDALAIAAKLDEERRTGRLRGPLHGIPILIKDNIDSGDRMMTTAGSLALVGPPAARDATLVARLRVAGAVLLGKTNLSEWANFRASPSTSGWSGRGGLTRNPYALDRNPSGSSSGSAVAVCASLCAAAIGTETDGSIVTPASKTGTIGIKPTVGLVSRAGIIPISDSQDTAGPMARTVAEVALLLGAIAGADARDPATGPADRQRAPDYTKFLDPDGLRGARIGVTRKLAGVGRKVDRVYDAAVADLRRMGAVVVEPADVPSPGELGGAEREVMLHEFKAGLEAYLATREDLPIRTLAELIAWNQKNAERELRYFGQEILLRAQEMGPLSSPAYKRARDLCRKLARTQGIDAVMTRHRLDALVAPTAGPAAPTDLVNGDRHTGGSSQLAAVAGYPSVTVPMGHVSALPVNISFFGRAWSEPTLIKLAFAFEQATRHRRPPAFLPTVGPE